MNDFLKKHSYLVVLISALAIIGAIAELIVQLNGTTSPFSWLTGGPHPRTANIAAAPPPPAPTPRVSITLQKTKKGNTLWVQWQNLPSNTVALNILRGKTGTDSADWSTWNTIPIAPGSAANGFLQIDLGRITEAGYSFEIQAVSSVGHGIPGSGNGTGAGPSSVLWTSSSTIPTITSLPPHDITTTASSTTTVPSSTPSSTTGTTTASSTTTVPSSTPSSTTGMTTASSTTTVPSSTPSSTTGMTTASSTPSGTPYYTPQMQVETYGTANNGTFLAENQNQGILIGWQNLPSATTRITVARSESANGPWTTILSQNNPSPSGSDDLQIVDSTVGTPYYYEMTAAQSTGGSISYGPVYVPAP